jgi:hypothetical protein
VTRRVSFAAAAALLAGCGYPGEPLPPALNRPMRVSDLTAVQRGGKVVVRFTVPKLTTEGLPIRDNPEIEIRIGEIPSGGWSTPAWEKSSTRVPARLITVKDGQATAEMDTAGLNGKTEVVMARVLGPAGRNIGWSAPINVPIVPPLPAPEGLAAKDAPDAVRLDWHAAAAQFRVFRSSATDPDWKQIGVADKPFYVDPDITFGTAYQYQVQAIEKTGDNIYAESEASSTITFTPADRFPPAAPTGLSAIPGARTIELVWERSTEKDFAFYRVYRDGKRVSDSLTSPAYSDKDAMPGMRYAYRVSAVDTAGNESAQSATVEAAIP